MQNRSETFFWNLIEVSILKVNFIYLTIIYSGKEVHSKITEGIIILKIASLDNWKLIKTTKI